MFNVLLERERAAVVALEDRHALLDLNVAAEQSPNLMREAE